MAALAAGPLEEDELVRSLGLDPDTAWDTDDDLHLMFDDRRLAFLLDGRIASGPALFDGVTVWHRVADEEVADRTIVLGPDLTVLVAAGADPGIVRVGDEETQIFESVPTLGLSPVVELPDAWCPDLAAGDLVGLTAAWPLDEETAVLTLVAPPASPPTPDEAAAARLVSAIEALAVDHAEVALGQGSGSDGAWVIELDDILPAAVAADPAALRDLGGPLADVLEGAGMGLAGGVLAGSGVSIELLLIYAVGMRIGRESDWATATAVGGAWVAISSGRADAPQQVLALLTDPDVCDAIASHLRTDGAPKAPEVVDALEGFDAPDDALGHRWLLAEALIADDRVVEAHEVLSHSVGDRLPLIDPEEWVGPIERYAQGRAFAGDLDAAIGAYRAIGEDRIVELLDHWRPAPRRDAGRNDRCPCGSGRKFKRCCMLNPPAASLADRSRLVWWKAMTICLDDHGACLPHPRVIVEMELPVALAIDTHLVEDGALLEIVERWGPLLPDDEVELLRTWADAPRRAWEIVAEPSSPRPAGAPAEVELRDVATDERVSVPADDIADGDGLNVGVVVSIDGAHRSMGEPVRVPVEAKDAVVEGLDRADGGYEVLELIADALPGAGDPDAAHALAQQALADHILSDDPG